MRGRRGRRAATTLQSRQHRHLRLADPDIEGTITVVEGGDDPVLAPVLAIGAEASLSKDSRRI
jgi:hypothetical protein